MGVVFGFTFGLLDVEDEEVRPDLEATGGKKTHFSHNMHL